MYSIALSYPRQSLLSDYDPNFDSDSNIKQQSSSFVQIMVPFEVPSGHSNLRLILDVKSNFPSIHQKSEGDADLPPSDSSTS